MEILLRLQFPLANLNMTTGITQGHMQLLTANFPLHVLRVCLTSIPALLVQRRLRWFGHAARRAEGELIKELFLPTPPGTWRRRAGGQLKTWVTTIKADLEPLS